LASSLRPVLLICFSCLIFFPTFSTLFFFFKTRAQGFSCNFNLSSAVLGGHSPRLFPMEAPTPPPSLDRSRCRRRQFFSPPDLRNYLTCRCSSASSSARLPPVPTPPPFHTGNHRQPPPLPSFGGHCPLPSLTNLLVPPYLMLSTQCFPPRTLPPQIYDILVSSAFPRYLTVHFLSGYTL